VASGAGEPNTTLARAARAAKVEKRIIVLIDKADESRGNEGESRSAPRWGVSSRVELVYIHGFEVASHPGMLEQSRNASRSDESEGDNAKLSTGRCQDCLPKGGGVAKYHLTQSIVVRYPCK
jgi:hypothetical protein